MNENGSGPYCGFGYLSLVSDPFNLVTWSQSELPGTVIFQNSTEDTKTSQMEPKVLNNG